MKLRQSPAGFLHISRYFPTMLFITFISGQTDEKEGRKRYIACNNSPSFTLPVLHKALEYIIFQGSVKSDENIESGEQNILTLGNVLWVYGSLFTFALCLRIKLL